MKQSWVDVDKGSSTVESHQNLPLLDKQKTKYLTSNPIRQTSLSRTVTHLQKNSVDWENHFWSRLYGGLVGVVRPPSTVQRTTPLALEVLTENPKRTGKEGGRPPPTP
eukprot:EG_transcript_47853